MEIFNAMLRINENTAEAVTFSIEDEQFQVNYKEVFAAGKKHLGNVNVADQVLLKEELLNRGIVIVYINDNRLLTEGIFLDGKADFIPSDTSYRLKCFAFTGLISLNQVSDAAVSVYNSEGKRLFTLCNIVSADSPPEVFRIDLSLDTVEYRFLQLGKIEYTFYHLFLIYDLFRKEIFTRKVIMEVNLTQPGIDYKLNSHEELEISFGSEKADIEFKKVAGKAKKVFDFYELLPLRENHLLGILTINEKKYYLHNKVTGTFLTRGNVLKVTGFRPRLFLGFLGSHLYIMGRSTHYAYKANGNYDFLFIDGSELPIGRFRRPFNYRLLRRYGYFKVPLSVLPTNDESPQKLYLGTEKESIHNLKLKSGAQKSKTIDFRKLKDRVVIARKTSKGNVSLSIHADTQEFTLGKRLSRQFKAITSSRTVTRIFRLLFVLAGKMPKRKNLIIFESFFGKQYSDNPRAIYEYIKESRSSYRLLWSVEKDSVNFFEDLKIPYIRRYSLKWYLTVPRAKYWVTNVRLPNWMVKPKGTVFVQTWHGTPLKKLGIDIDEIHMPGTQTENYKRNFVMESGRWDYLISPNPYSTEIFKRAFLYKGKIVESGYPRNDVLSMTSEDIIMQLKKGLGIPEGKKVMLYAPTWRDNDFYEKGKYKFEFQFDLEKWKREFGDEWVLLSRMHYLVAENFDFSAHEGSVYDVSAYPDIRDLYLMADLLITDYSSVFFDYAILDRPIIFFMYDLEQYRDQLRGFYLDIEEEAPGPIVQTEEELFEAIKGLGFSEDPLDAKFHAFKDKFVRWEDGHAAERAVKAFLE